MRGLPGSLALLALPWSASCGVGECRSPDGVVEQDAADLFGGDELRAVTLNVLHGFFSDVNDRTLEARLDHVVGALAALAPDVVFVQEASLTTAEAHCDVVAALRAGLGRASEAPWSSVHAVQNGSDLMQGFEGPAVLARWRLRDGGVLEYAAQAPWQRRAAARAVLDGERALALFSAHLDGSDAAVDGVRAGVLQAREVAAALAGASPSLLGGDLNADLDEGGADDVPRAFLDEGARDLWRESGGGDGVGTELLGAVDDEGATLGARIDGMFAHGGGVGASSCERVLDGPAEIDGERVWPSDHAGVLCVVTLAR